MTTDAAGTDGDGLADGQELFVVTGKTPKRYPIQNRTWAFTDNVALNLAAPAWSIRSMDLMSGFTHLDMGQLQVILDHYRGGLVERQLTLRSYQNAGESNNFTSYDLLNKGLVPSEFTSGGVWYLQAWDNVADLKRGQVEYMQLQIAVRTLPNRADTDADGLNDSEEVNLASDGFQTNPWTADTDADGIADGLESNGWARSGSTIIANANGFKTDPTRADTDHDGVRDDRDYVPLGDAFITVTIVSATVYGGTDDDPTPNALEPFIEVSYNASFAYTASGSAPSGGTAYFGHTYSANVADDVRFANVYFWMEDYDADDVHDSFAINGTSTFASASHDLSLGPGYTSHFNVTGSGTLRAAPLRVTIKTVVPDRIDARFVLPADYAGVYNVTNAAGSIVGRRYVGEPRFVALALNVTTPASWQCLISGGCDDSSVEPKVLLLPRSVFFESRLYAKLAARDLSGLPAGLAFRQNSTTASSNSDGLQEILSGNVTSSEYLAVLDLLLRNATNAYVHVALNLTNDLFLYGLPDEAARLVGYKPLPSTPSVLYRFCATPNCGAAWVDKPIWERIWEGIVSTVTGWIVSAVVLAYNAFRMIVEILAQVGAWFAQAVDTARQAVASAVQAAAKAVAQFVDAAMRFIEDIIRKTIDFLVAPLLAILREWSGELHGIIQRIMGVGDTDEQDVLMLDNVLFNSKVAMLANAIAIGIQVAISAITILSIVLPGAQAISAILKQVILQALKAAAEHWLASSLLTLGATAIIGALIPKDSPVWQWTSGIGTLVVALVVVLVQKIIGERLGKVTKFLDGDRYGLYITLIGFFVSVGILGSGLSGMAAVVTAWIGVVLSGVGVLISSVYNSWNDVLPMGIGFADELVTVAALGFSVGVAATTKG